jgi:peptidoglycan/xylan/chitin deacetylase (PgdA/CDA1 family)
MSIKTTVHNSTAATMAASRSAGLAARLRLARIWRSQLMRRYTDWKIGATRQEKLLYRDSTSIVLTFDDFGSATQIEQILNILSGQNVRAVFFLEGDWAKHNPKLVARIADQGHFIGNHTASHRDLLKLTDAEVRREIKGGPISPLMRPPMGRYDARIRRITASMGQAIAYWSIDSDDWQGVSIPYMYEKILRQLHPGAVILFHLHADNTAELLPQLIPAIRQRGYNLLAFDEPFMEVPHV